MIPTLRHFPSQTVPATGRIGSRRLCRRATLDPGRVRGIAPGPCFFRFRCPLRVGRCSRSGHRLDLPSAGVLPFSGDGGSWLHSSPLPDQGGPTSNALNASLGLPYWRNDIGISFSLKDVSNGDKPLSTSHSFPHLTRSFIDPVTDRFKALEKSELSTLEIEISVVSPAWKVGAWDQVQVGRDGLIVRSQGQSGLLLPQVATEYGWDRDTFLSHKN